MEQILAQLSEAWNLAGELLQKAETDQERVEIRKRMEQISALMEETVNRTFTENDDYYRSAISAFKKNQKDIQQFKRSLDRSTAAAQLLTDIVARVDSLLRHVT